MACLCRHYRELDESHLEKANMSLSKPSNAEEPFRVFIKRIEDTMDTAEAVGTLYLESQIVLRALNLVKKADMYQEGVRE